MAKQIFNAKIDATASKNFQEKYNSATPQVKKIFDSLKAEGYKIMNREVATDLPNSETVDNGSIPIRIIEQLINYTNFDWPFLKDIPFYQVMNGVFDITYRDTFAGDTTSAFSAVTLEDFNGDELPSARLTFKVDKQYHIKLKVPYSMLNQIFINQGNWNAFFDNFAWLQGRDFGAERVKQFLTTIDGLATTPSTINVDSTATMEEQTRIGYGEFVKQILNLKTPSKTTAIDNTIGGNFSGGIINSWQPSELLIYVDYRAYADLKAYLYSGAYHLEEAKIIDLAMKPMNLPSLAATLGITLTNIADAVAIVMSKGKANEKAAYSQFFQYGAIINSATPKAFNILHYYNMWSDCVNPQGHLSVYKISSTAPTA